MASKTLHLHRTYRFRPVNGGVVLLDGAPLNLSTGSPSITVLFWRPDGTQITGSASIVNAAGGIVEFVCDVTFLDTVGQWRRNWRLVQGAIDVVLEEEIRFQVAA